MLSQGELDSLTLCQRDSMSCHDRGGRLRTYRGGSPPMRMIDRETFDAFLAGRAACEGAELADGLPVEAVEGGLVRTPRGTFRCGSLVAADGAAGAAGRSLRGSRLRTGPGLELFLPVPDGFPDDLQIHFGGVEYGYGWIFPRVSDACAGVGSCRPGGAGAMPAALDAMLGKAGLTSSGARLLGAPIPAGRPFGLGGDGAFLAGDAAGLTDQLTGEGISHAIESGLLVARAILEGWSAGRLRREAMSGCLGLVRQSLWARHLVYSPIFSGRAMRGLGSRDFYYEGYWRLVSGDADYRSLIPRLLRSRLSGAS
jgi:flavin-dependent dehydrogenase